MGLLSGILNKFKCKSRRKTMVDTAGKAMRKGGFANRAREAHRLNLFILSSNLSSWIGANSLDNSLAPVGIVHRWENVVVRLGPYSVIYELNFAV